MMDLDKVISKLNIIVFKNLRIKDKFFDSIIKVWD